MGDSLFSNIYKSSLENYCTEIFAYILKRLIETEDKLAYKLLELFGFNNIKPSDLKYIDIITQERHSSIKNKSAIPDIIIKFNDIVNIIEVKVDSKVNYYEIDNKRIDQIKLYKKIKDKDIKINEVYLLSKFVIFCESLDDTKRILWSQIYSILSNSGNEIINQFRLFLEENGMKSYKLESGAEKAIDSIQAIMGLIEQSWTNEKYKLIYPEGSPNYIGYYIKDKKTAWIGQNRARKNYLVFEVICDNLVRKAKKIAKEKNIKLEWEKSDAKYIFGEQLSIKKIASYKTAEEQVKCVTKWCNKIINELSLK